MKGDLDCEMKDVEIIEQLSQIDWWYVLIAIVLLLLAIKSVWSLFDWFVFTKLGIETKKMKEQRESREQLKATTELAKTTAKNLEKLEKRHTTDETNLEQKLDDYITESQRDRKALQDEMAKLAKNRIDDRKQSLEIQKELRDSITCRDSQIESLIAAEKEILAAKINEKYKYYISIDGIPEDEYDEFVSMHAAYKGVGGNSHGDAKFEYCMEHLSIIPVNTKLVIKHDKD